ncbi:MAG TPA: glycosyltransferase [Blastocatellia bacterium]|nr:glycosyltransferase [Blastocatellia bacterium]
MTLNHNHQIQPVTRRPRILLLAYACSPYRGSEYTVGWGRAQETAKHFETWVLCGPESEPDIKRYAAEHGIPEHLHFCFPESVDDYGLLRRLPTLYAHNYLAMWSWHRRAYQRAVQLHREFKFDLVHHVNITGFREPGYLWRLDAPFVWGPVSGTQNLPWRFIPTLGVVDATKELVRGAINLLQLYGSWRVRKASRRAVTVIAANTQIQHDFASAQGVRPERLLETGLHHVKPKTERKDRGTGPLRILWCGELKSFKGLHLLLDALARVPSSISYRLSILGQGPRQQRWQALAASLGIDQYCHWKGFVPYTEVLAAYDQADLFVFTSLRDTSGNVMLEALSRGLPVICPEHQGAQDIISPECGIKIPVTTPRQFIAGLTAAISGLATDADQLERLSRGALKRARSFLWQLNGEQMNRFYRQALAVSQRPAQAAAIEPGVTGDVLHLG